MHSIPETKILAGTARSIRTGWRWFSGAHMDGMPRTDAGWFAAGTRPLAGVGRVSRWTLMPRATRAAIRTAATATGSGSVFGYLTAPDVTMQAAFGVGAAGSLAAGYSVAETALRWRHMREWVRPLHRALERPLGLPEGTVPQSYIRIPRDYPTRTDVGRIDLPAAFTGADTAAVSSIVKAKLGLTDVSVSFQLAGRRPHLILTQTPRPPGKVLFADEDVRELVTAAPESAPLIGVGPRGITVSVDLDSESPHILVSASTGGGKSVITRTMTAQLLHGGAQLAVLDFKRHSHKWAKGLPNVAYARDIADIHDALVSFGAEGHRRNILVDDWEGDEKDCPVGPRIGILLEEANATISKLKRYWSEVREKDDPKESPAIDALREVLFMGRAVKIHVFLVAQSATAAALGGPEVRECFATRILARYTRNAWNMLVPEVQPVPRSTRHVGRAQVVLGGVAHETQIAFFENDEAREYAMSGTVGPTFNPATLGGPVTVSRESVWLPHQGEQPSTSRDTAPRLTLVKEDQGATVAAGPRRYTLAEAARESVVPMKADALRQAKRRDPEFPEGSGGKWTAEELQRWHRNRERATGAAGGA